MKKMLSFCALLTVSLPFASGSVRARTYEPNAYTQIAAQAPSLSNGVYTEQQATRGKIQYVDHCSACHQTELQGSDLAPPLKGDDFVMKWSGSTLQDLFDTIATTMPGDAPGSLMPQVNADILAYVLQVNKFPAGHTELKPDAAALKAIALETKKP